RRRLAADALPCADEPRGPGPVAPTGGRRAHHHLRQPLHRRDLAVGGPGRRHDAALRTPGHRAEVPRPPPSMTWAEVEPVSAQAPELSGAVMMNQRWLDLTFLHWAVDPGLVADRMPPGVRPDTLDGVTYVGLIPFRMVGAGIARGPGVPWLGTFLETNVRLYSVDETGRRGIVFLSLDADRA